MFVAQLHRKLTRHEEDMEDLLTSDVFGTWRYLSPKLGLVQFLETAEQLLDGTKFALAGEVEKVNLEFWPWIRKRNAKNTQPDVLMEIIFSNQDKWLILVEAKFLSGKSSFQTEDMNDPPNDQLAREMHNLRIIQKQRGFQQYAVIYVTAHTVIPRDDINEAVSELLRKTGESSVDHFYWTSWRRLPMVLKEVRDSCDECQALMLRDLQQILENLNLVFFNGFTSRGWTLGEPSWTFQPSQVVFDWEQIIIEHYSFEIAPKEFQWRLCLQPEQIQWSFKTWKKRIKGR
jgi:hypothetical protein